MRLRKYPSQNALKQVLKTASLGLMLLNSTTLAFAGVTQQNIIESGSHHQYTLSELLNAALYKNPAIPGKRSEIEAKEYISDSARAGRYPSVSLQAGYVNSHYNDTSYNESILSLRARQPLWAFGRIDDGIAYADADVRVQQADLVRVTRDLLDKTTVAYLQLVSIKQRQQVLDENIQTLEKLHTQIHSRYEGNLASKADVDLAYLRLLQARSDADKLQGEWLLAVTDLQSLTQLPITQVASVTPALIQLPKDETEIEAQILGQSAELEVKTRQLDLARANSEKELSAMMPTLYLQATKELNDLYASNGEQIGIMMDASLDGLGFSRIGQSKAAKAQEMSALEGVNVARNELLRQLRSLLHTRKTQGAMQQALAASVSSFQTVLDSYVRQYIAGKKNWLEVLNIQKEMTSTQLELVQTRIDWYRASLKLMVLMGQLDQAEQSIADIEGTQERMSHGE